MEYRIDDLARRAGMTVRNVRSYQDRELIPAPVKKGRVAWYSEAHLARLRLIGDLLERGYNLENIRELVSAWESGQDIAALLGLETAVAGPVLQEAPVRMRLDEIYLMFRGVKPAEVLKAARINLFKVDGLHVEVRSARLLKLGEELHNQGIPFGEIIETMDLAMRDTEKMAERFVKLIVRNKIAPYGDELPPPEVAPELASLVSNLRPMATVAADAIFSLALEKKIREEVGDRIHRFYDQMQSNKQQSDD